MNNSPEPGWYHAEGDALNTERYWDGTQWTQGPRPVGGTPPGPPTDMAITGPSGTANGGFVQPTGYAASAFPESSQADLALILSSVGGFISLSGFCCAPLVFIGLPLAIAGAVFGHSEIKAIDSGRRDPSKRDFANVARIIGGIVIGLCAIGIGLVALFGALGALG